MPRKALRPPPAAVDLLGAADEAHRGQAVAPAVEGGVGGRDHLGMGGETQVVVGAEIENLLAGGDGDPAALGCSEDAFSL